MAQIECGLLAPSEFMAVTRLLAKVFSACEPPAVAMGLGQADLERFVRLLCPRALAEGLTVVARDGDTGEVVGVMLADDFGVPAELVPGTFSSKFLPILAMLESADEEYRRARSIVAGQYLHLFMLGVDERFGGRGIATQLVSECLRNGHAKGYTHALTEATGVVSQRVFRKLGFRDQVRVSYRDYRYEGQAVFAGIREHEAAILMDCEIG